MKKLSLALLLCLPCAAFGQQTPASSSSARAELEMPPPPVTAAPAPAAAAAPSKGMILLAPKVGFFKTTTPLAGNFYGALELGLVTPLLDNKLAVVLEGNFHQPRLKSSLTDDQLTATADGTYGLAEREIAALLSLVYRAEDALGPVTPYGGLGGGFYYHQAKMTAFDSTYIETEGTFGFQALVGAELALGPGGGFFEAHYHFTNIGFLSTGAVNVGGFLAASLGYRLRF